MCSSDLTPKTLWRNIMGRIHENLEYRDFTQPEGITTAAVCKKSGKLAVEGLCDADPRGSMVETEFFAARTVPTEYCDHHVSATICTASGMLANEFCPQENRQGGIYIVGGSPDTEDGPFLLSDSLSQENYCTVHTAASMVPEIPPVEIPDQSQGITGKPNKDDKEHTSDKKEDDDPPEDEMPEEPEDIDPPEDNAPEDNNIGENEIPEENP